MKISDDPILDEYQREELEIDLFLRAIKSYYGYDFNHYARASLRRRILQQVEDEGRDSIVELLPLFFEDRKFFGRFLKNMSVTVTTMFRNPQVFLKIREVVLRHLATYPFITIWHAGCATGEEAYTMAILLEEEGLLERSHIYATDYNCESLKIGHSGIYPLEHMKKYTENYLEAGGKRDFVDYYQAKYDSVIFAEHLRNHITFTQHNLMNDHIFCEAHLVLCRNVLIYFKQVLQNRVIGLLKDSLVHRGFMVLGDRESLDFSAHVDDFELVAKGTNIFRKCVR